MPQLTQLPEIFWSQLFWLTVVFGIIFFVIGRGMLPKIQSTVELRDEKFAKDLAAAQAARTETDAMEEAYRARMDASRAEAMKLTAAAKSEVAKAIEKKIAKADSANQAKLDKAQERIREAREAAKAEIASAAAEMTQDVAAKVAGLKVGKDEALKAVQLETVRG
jgi:F-type H+-transporting ATPase subunit b